MKPERIEKSVENRVIVVGSDCETIQEALCQVPFFLEHKYRIVIPDGNYIEDLVLPTYYLDRGDPINGRISGLKITGNKENSNAVKISSIWIAGGKTNRIAFDGLSFIGDGPYGDAGASFEVRQGAIAVLHNINFKSRGDALRAVCCYGGGILAKGPVDIGMDIYTNGFVNKNGGFIDISGKLTGKCTKSTLWNQRGNFTYDRKKMLAKGSPAVRCSASPIYNYITGESNSIMTKGFAK